MSQQITQEQINAMLQQYQRYQQQAEALSQQLNMIQMTLVDTEKAVETIDGMSKQEKDSEVLMPIGAGSYIHAALKKPDTVIVGVGSGICIEQQVASAREILEKRKQEIAEAQRQMQENLTKITGELQKLQQALSQIQQQAQTPQVQQPLTGM